MKLILASTSPRRKSLLASLRVPFETTSPSFDEEAVPFAGDPTLHAVQLAEGKASSVRAEGIVLAADTLVYCEGRLFPKPGTIERAKVTLSQLVGKTHTVITAVTARCQGQVETETRSTKVTFYPLTETQIDHYVRAIDPTDKAGGYTIEGAGGLVVKEIYGCYSNVLGLPLHAAALVLKRCGLDLWQQLDWPYSS
ncbi:MAG: nucleoside triphosphate pyrophosphatase [Parachlamydiales bacterium]